MRPTTELAPKFLDPVLTLPGTSAPRTSLMVQPAMLRQKQLVPLGLLIPPMTLDQAGAVDSTEQTDPADDTAAL